MLFISRHRKYTRWFVSLCVLFSLLVVFAYHRLTFQTNSVGAQETNALSPTPSIVASTVSDIPPINPETLHDPEAFKLDQQIKQATGELFASTDNSTRENKASYRKTLMQHAIQKYPYVFLGNALTDVQRSSFEQSIQQYFEKPFVLSDAELGVMHIDDFENHTNSRFDYALQNLQERKQFNFYPAGEFGGHISGTTLNVNGIVLDENIAARVMNASQGGENNNDPVPTNVEILQEASPDALGPQRVAVILLKEKQVQNPYYSKEQIEDMIFTGEVQKFLKEASYNKTWLDEEKSKVYGWYERDEISHPYAIFDNRLEIIKLTDPDIDFSRFDRIMIGVSKLNTYPDGRTSVNTGLGKGNVGKTTYKTADGEVELTFSTFGIGSNSHVTFVHELGHNFGVFHANWLDCSRSTIERAKNYPDSIFIDGCVHVEYGNWLDVMGSGPLNHFNGYFKEVFRWLNEADKSIVSIGQPGVYNLKLKPLEFNNPVVAKILNQNASNFNPFYVEYRANPQGNPGSDIWLGRSGLMINKIYEPLRSHLLWPDPSQDYPLVNFLPQGKPFTDEKSGVTITHLSIDEVNQEAEIKVELKEPECKSYTFNTKMVDIYAYPYNSSEDFGFEQADMNCDNDHCILKRKQGEQLLFTFYLQSTNNNTYACPDTHLRAVIDDPWKKASDLGQATWLVASGETGYFTPSAIIPSETPAGTYPLSVTLRNTDNNNLALFFTQREVEIQDEIPVLEGDLTADGKVDIFDLVTVAKDFGKKGEGFDGDGDKNGVVDIFDLVIVAKNFGKKI